MKKTLLTLGIAIASYSLSFAQWTTGTTNINNTNTNNVGIGTTSPPRKLTVSNNGAEGLEIGPGNLVGDAANAVTSVYYNRSSGLFVNNIQAAASYTFVVDGVGTPPMSINSSGNVGIGTVSPTFKLDVAGNFRTVSNGHTAFLATGAGSGDGLVLMNNASDVEAIRLYTNGVSYFNGGNVGIGTSSPDEKLTVKGTIHSTEVKVTTSALIPDYVFEPNYKLTELSEVKSYINQNHHLPEIPSAAQIEKEGLNLGDMNIRLLKKVEELTLYLIEQQKINQNLQLQIDQLAKKN